MAFLYDLRDVHTKTQLLKYIGIDSDYFDLALSFDIDKYNAGRRRATDTGVIVYSMTPYTMHEIPKNNPSRGNRIVWEADSHLNNIYKGLARKLGLFFRNQIKDFPHPNCLGYVRGKNIRDNAMMHLGKNYLLRTDIQDFFPSITTKCVCEVFQRLDVCDFTSKQISAFLTINNELALGLPTSPLIANMICHEMDKQLAELAKTNRSTYTRYADDLAFSSEQEIQYVDQIFSVLKHFGFKVNKDKTRQTKRGQTQYVTGLSVSDNERPHPPRKMKRQLRQILYFSKKFGLQKHAEKIGIPFEGFQHYINRVDGLVKYISYHEPRLATKLKTEWQSILDQNGDYVSFEPKNLHQSAFQFYIDETEFEWNGKKYLALGMSVSQQQALICDTTHEVLRDYLADPLSDGDKNVIRKNGIHFSDATEDLKLKFVDKIQQFPFNGYIVFGELTDPSQYSSTYTNLLGCVIERRLIAAESRCAIFNFENSNKIDKKAIQNLIKRTHQKLAAINNRRPAAIKVNFVGKNDNGVAVPDFLLGIFRKYMMSSAERDPPQREHIFFEKIRDKIRVIIDADTGEEFTRRNPISNVHSGADMGKNISEIG